MFMRSGGGASAASTQAEVSSVMLTSVRYESTIEGSEKVPQSTPYISCCAVVRASATIERESVKSQGHVELTLIYGYKQLTFWLHISPYATNLHVPFKYIKRGLCSLPLLSQKVVVPHVLKVLEFLVDFLEKQVLEKPNMAGVVCIQALSELKL